MAVVSFMIIMGGLKRGGWTVSRWNSKPLEVKWWAPRTGNDNDDNSSNNSNNNDDYNNYEDFSFQFLFNYIYKTLK